MARYQLAAIGVLDTAEAVFLLPGCDGWAAYQAWIAAGNVPDPVAAVAPSREALIADLWGAVKERREQCKAGGVEVGGYWFHTDIDSRLQWLGMRSEGESLSIGLPWKTMSGAFTPITAQLVADVYAAIKAKEIAAFARGEALRAALNAADDPREIDIAAGWPASFNDPAPIPETP
jgi:hypothetical protein